MRTLNTTQERLKTQDMLSTQSEALGLAIKTAHHKHKLSLTLLQQDTDKKRAYLQSNKEWNFNFTSGGWNTVYAQDKEQAIRIAKEQYNETVHRYHSSENGGSKIPLTEVDESTFRVATEADTKALLSLFY